MKISENNYAHCNTCKEVVGQNRSGGYMIGVECSV